MKNHHEKSKSFAALLTVMRYEWRILKADRIAQITVLLFTAIVACALLNGFAASSKQQQKASEGKSEQTALSDKIRQEIIQAEHARTDKGESLALLKSDTLAPSAVCNKMLGFKATLPLESGAMLNAGQIFSRPQTFEYKTGARFTPFYPTVGTRSLGSFFPETSTDNPLLMLLGQFDLAFVTLYIFPLIILVLGFNIIAADRESGVLALMLAQPVRLRTIVLGKIFVRALLVIVIGVILPIVVASVIAVFRSENQLGRIIFTSAFWILTATVYGGFWFALIALINATNRSAAANGLIAAVCWIAFVVLIPALINLAVQFFIPSASSFEFVTAERESSLELNSRIDAAGVALNQFVRARYPIAPGDKASQERYDAAYFYEPVNLPKNGELFSDFIKEHPDWKRAETADQLNRALIEIKKYRMEERLAKILENSNRQRERQKNLENILRFAAPTFLARVAFDDITGTGNERYENFLAQLDDYIRGRENFFSRKILNRENINARDFDNLAAFEYREEKLSETLKRIIVPLLALALLSVVLIFFAGRFYRSFSVI